MRYWRKMIAPVLAASIILLYYIGIAGFLSVADDVPSVIKVLLMSVPLLFVAALFG